MAIQRASIDEYMKSVQSQQQMSLVSATTPNGEVKNYYMLQTPTEPTADNNMTMILLGVVAMVMISAIAIVAISKKK